MTSGENFNFFSFFGSENLEAEILIKLKAQVEAKITLLCCQPPDHEAFGNTAAFLFLSYRWVN